MNAARSSTAALRPSRAPAWPASQRRNQPVGPRLAARGRRCPPGPAALGGADDEVPDLPKPSVPDFRGVPTDEIGRVVARFHAESAAWRDAKWGRARAQARPAAPSEAPLVSLAAAWPPVADSALPAASEARTAAAEAAAAAAVSYAAAAVGHEAAADAAHAKAATQPASAQAAAGAEWLHASAAWRKAFESLEAAQRAAPGSAVVQEAAAEVEAARRFKRQLRCLSGGAAEDLP